MAGRSPSTTTPKVRIRDTNRVRESRPCEPSPSAECRSSVRPPTPSRGLVASADLQLRSLWSGLDRGGRPPPLSSSEGGRATQHARSLFVSIIARGTTQCATTLTTRNATRMCKIYVGLPTRTVREPVRPRVTEQCVSSSLHSASQSVTPGDARQCERQCGLRNPQQRGVSTTWDPGGAPGQVQRLLIRVRGVKLV
jgi:hypothetical protein